MDTTNHTTDESHTTTTDEFHATTDATTNELTTDESQTAQESEISSLLPPYDPPTQEFQHPSVVYPPSQSNNPQMVTEQPGGVCNSPTGHGHYHTYPLQVMAAYPPIQSNNPQMVTEQPGGVHPSPAGHGHHTYPLQVMANTYQPAATTVVQRQNINNHGVVRTQPSRNIIPAVNIPTKPPDFLALSVFTCLCCCWPFGLIALIFSCQVNSSWESRNYNGARFNSTCSLIWNILGILGGIAILIFTLISVFTNNMSTEQ